MNRIRLFGVTIMILLCLTSVLVFAQDAPMNPPNQPLVPCPEKVTTDTKVKSCDMLATKPEDIVGIWTVYFNAEPAFIRYNADGTWLIADTAAHTDAASVKGYPSGTYSFDDKGVFTSLDTTLPEGCTAGHYLLRVIKVVGQPVALNHAVLDDCFVPRRTDWAYTLLWVSSL